MYQATSLVLVLLVLTGCSPAATGRVSASPGRELPSASPPAPSPSPPSPSPTPTAVVSQRLEAPLPEARQEVASARLGNATWVLGGFDAGGRSADSVFVLGPGGWVRGPNLPQRTDHAAAAVLDGSLFFGGGFSDGAALATFYVQTSDGRWAPRARLHHPRGALALVAAGGRILALGGNGPAGNEPAVESYDPAHDAWTDVAALPVPRNHVAGFSYGSGLACVAGGRSPAVARVDCLEPARMEWSRLPDLPLPTSGAGAGALGLEVVVAGGENAGESTLVPTVFRFDGRSWASEPMLIPRHGIALSSDGRRLWACGGATAPGYAASDQCTSLA